MHRRGPGLGAGPGPRTRFTDICSLNGSWGLASRGLAHCLPLGGTATRTAEQTTYPGATGQHLLDSTPCRPFDPVSPRLGKLLHRNNRTRTQTGMTEDACDSNTPESAMSTLRRLVTHTVGQPAHATWPGWREEPGGLLCAGMKVSGTNQLGERREMVRTVCTRLC